VSAIARVPALAALAVAVCAGGCATQSRAPGAVVTPLATRVLPAERVKHGVVPGTSTRADVIAALGASLAIRFDSGYEVWVYRLENAVRGAEDPLRRFFPRRTEPAAADEFVILFAPSGIVAKTRLRTASPSRRDAGNDVN
jgi:hypothetical protein